MNLETIEQIVSLISAHPVSEITVEQDGGRIHVRKSAVALPTPSPGRTDSAPADARGEADAQPPETDRAVAAEAEPIVLTSPMVGLFHHQAQPIPYGGLIAPGQIVGSIESMKLMNDVPAEQGGRVVEVLVEDGAPVEYGQPLFRLAAA